MEIISDILSEQPRCPSPPEFVFEMTPEAAEKNYLLLMKKYKGSLALALENHRESTMGYGSEFRHLSTLSRIFKRHPNWDRMTTILTNGSDWPLAQIDEDSRLRDVKEALAFGNHKGASLQPDLLLELVGKDVHFGYSLPLPLNKATQIPGILIAPMNIQKQHSIDDTGRIIDKDRLTHDQSYKWGSGTSVNSRINKDELLPCMFGPCISRLVNWAVSARKKFPNRAILASKADFKSAYRRLHLSAATALQTCTQLSDSNLLLMTLRLTFGGTPGPYEWGALSESICDLAMAILHHSEWDPSVLKAQHQHLVPTPKRLDESIPWGVGLDLIVDVPINPRGVTDIYIDDLITLTVDIPGTDNLARGMSAALLAIDSSSRRNHAHEPIPRESMDARDKLIAEAGLEETKMILGWFFDFRRLRISLPDNKYIAWSSHIHDLLQRGTSTAKELETIIGRLGHLALVVPGVYHFLSRLRELQRTAKNRRQIKINDKCMEDLHLMLRFLIIGKEGIDMNIISYRRPTHIYRSDSCPYGLGGYSNEGFAWRFELPTHLRFRASNNVLEYIASIISPWIDIIEGRLKRGDCVLSMTDSTTSAGWLHKTNFKEVFGDDDPDQATARIAIARTHATLLLEQGIKEYSQWFPGKDNNVADALSRDFDRSDSELISILRSSCPSQLPPHFQIVQLPNGINPWLTSSLLKLPVKEQLREAHTTTDLGRGNASASTSTPSASPTTLSSTRSPVPNETRSSDALPWLCGKDGFLTNLMEPWLVEQSEIPSRVFRRHFENTADQTQQKTKTYNLASFYTDNTAHSKTTTHQKNNSKPSQPVSLHN